MALDEEVLRKLAHDIRGPVHSAKLNLEAARSLAARLGGKEGERLLKHLEIIQTELDKLQHTVTASGRELGREH